MICCATGHRPNKLGGYSTEAFSLLENICYYWITDNVEKLKITHFISGMALGWDQAVAEAVINYNTFGKYTKLIKLTAALPFAGQEIKWPIESKKLYFKLLSLCDEIVYVSDVGYNPAKMQIRNEWMVNKSDLVVAMFDGTTGGTHNCIKYAKSKNKQIVNLYGQYINESKKTKQK